MDPWSSSYKSQQGNVGLGRAIAYYTSVGYPIMIPLNDTQKYDIVVDNGTRLLRVSIKTTRGKTKNKKSYIVILKNSGGSSGKSVIRKFDNSSCDIVFILTKDGTMYEISAKEIKATTGLTLDSRWDKYIVQFGNSSIQEETLDMNSSLNGEG